MATKLEFQISAIGAGKTVGELLAIKAALDKAAQTNPALKGLAQALGATQKQAEQLAGKTETATDAISALAKALSISEDDARNLTTTYKLNTAQAAALAERIKDLNGAFVDGSGKLRDASGRFIKIRDVLADIPPDAEKAIRGFQGLDSVLQGFGQGAGQMAFSVIQNALTAIPQSIAANTLQFERFRTVLTTTLGTAEKADEALAGIRNFAATTPFQLDEVINAYIALANRGIEPTNAALTQLGDIASSQGKSLGQITEAILDATSGEFERLKEFGITARTAGDQVTLAFKGVNVEVAKTPDAIAKAILGFGDIQGVAGGMDALSATLGGQLSNLQDNLSKAAVAFGDELVPPLLEFVQGINQGGDSLEDLARSLGQGVGELLRVLVEAFKLGAENAELLGNTLQIVVAGLIAVKAQIALNTFVGLAAGITTAQAASLGFSKQLVILKGALSGATVANAGFLATLAPLLPLLIAVAAGVAAIKWVQYVNDLRAANEATADLETRIRASGDESMAAASRTQAAVNRINEARKKGQPISQQELTDARNLIAANDLRLKQLKEELEAAQKLPEVNEDQARAKAGLIQQTETNIRALQGQNDALKAATSETKSNTDATKKQISAIEALNNATEKRLDAAQLAETQALNEIAQLELSGAVSKEEIEQRKLQAAQNRIAAELEAERDRLAQLEALGKQANAEQEEARQAAISKAQQKIAQLELAGTQARINAVKEAEQAALQELEKANAKAEAEIQRSQTERITALREAQLQAQAEGRDISQETEEEIAKVQRDAIAETLAQRRKELAEVQKLRAEGTLSTEQAAKKEQELNAQIGQLNLQRIEAELAAQKRAQETKIKAIREELAEQERASRTQIAGIERIVNKQRELERSLQSQSELLRSQGELQAALTNLQQTGLQTQLTNLQRAGELAAALNSGQIRDSRSRMVIERELSQLGLSRATTELQFLDRRQALEDRIAASQLQALQQQQAGARAAQELELRRNEIASQRELTEARIAEIQARQNVNAAQAGLREAQVRGDSGQIASAQLDVQLAEESARLAQQNTQAVRDNQAAQAEIAINARATLEAQQAAELATARAAEQARQFAQALERAQTAANGVGRRLGAPQARRDGGPVQAGHPYLVGEEGPELIVPRRGGQVLTARETAQIMQPHLGSGMPRMAIPNQRNSGELLKEVQGLRGDLRKSRPTQNNSFTLVNEQDPYDKVLRLQSDLLRNQIRSAGL